jgi:hypothetical protein
MIQQEEKLCDCDNGVIKCKSDHPDFNNSGFWGICWGKRAIRV